MGFIKEVKEMWLREFAKREEQKQKYRIEYAFSSGGTKYYRYEDIQNLPFERGLVALSMYNEVEMRCDRKFLKKYTDVVAELLREKTIDIYKLNALNEVLQQRLSLTCDVELMYKLASVVFFDKKENPLVYEQAYAEKKIEKWKKDMSVNAFFLQMPLRELMPFLNNAKIDLDIYSKLNEEINALHSQLLRMNGSTAKPRN
jgi:hypothetical protein